MTPLDYTYVQVMADSRNTPASGSSLQVVAGSKRATRRGASEDAVAMRVRHRVPLMACRRRPPAGRGRRHATDEPRRGRSGDERVPRCVSDVCLTSIGPVFDQCASPVLGQRLTRPSFDE
jgi:hypothetical protein